MPFGGPMNIMSSPINAFNSYSMMGSLPFAGICNCVCKCKCSCNCNCAETTKIPHEKISRKFRPIIKENNHIEPVQKPPETIKQIPKDIKPVE